jgi:opacity protein-like surface antigen
MGFSAGSFNFADDEEVFDDSTSTYRIVGGYRFNENFGLEGGWGETGDIEVSETEFIPQFGNITVNLGVDFEVLTVRALGFLPFDRLSLVGGVGYYDADFTITGTASALGMTVSESDSDSENGATLVGGLEFNLERIDIRGELEWFDIDDAEAWDFSIGVLFHF